MGLTPHLNQWLPGAHSPGVNRPERGGDHKTPSSDVCWDSFTYTIYSIHIVKCVTSDMSNSIYSTYLDSKNSKYIYKIQYNTLP